MGIDGNNIVGYYTNPDNSGGAFLYNGTTWTALDYAEAGGLAARDILGNRIVGNYYGDYAQHGFILTIPEPTTLSLLALGVLALMKRKR